MTAEEARKLFDPALDGELDADTMSELEHTLAADAALRAEYDAQRALLRATAELSHTAPVDLLAGVQHKLRARSGGKFYRDRFAQRRSGSSESLRLTIIVSACLIVGVLLWFAYDAGLLAIRR